MEKQLAESVPKSLTLLKTSKTRKKSHKFTSKFLHAVSLIIIGFSSLKFSGFIQSYLFRNNYSWTVFSLPLPPQLILLALWKFFKL